MNQLREQPLASDLSIFGKFSVTQQKANEIFADQRHNPSNTLMIRGNVLENISDPEIIRFTLSKLAKVEDVRLVRQHESRIGSKPMRDFAFVEFASIAESKKVHDFVQKYGLILEGSEVSVIYCRGNKPISDL